MKKDERPPERRRSTGPPAAPAASARAVIPRRRPCGSRLDRRYAVPLVRARRTVDGHAVIVGASAFGAGVRNQPRRHGAPGRARLGSMAQLLQNRAGIPARAPESGRRGVTHQRRECHDRSPRLQPPPRPRATLRRFAGDARALGDAAGAGAGQAAHRRRDLRRPARRLRLQPGAGRRPPPRSRSCPA